MSNMPIGLLVPDRPPTPCDGRAQHYRRPGITEKQKTRNFSNGTTLIFGPEDPIDEFKPVDAFYEQILLIESATSDINVVVELYRKVPAGGLGLDKDRLSILDVSASENFPGRLWGSSQDITSSTLAAQIGVEVADSKSATDAICPVFVTNDLNIPAKCTANVYQSTNRSCMPGSKHPGFSTDQRGGGTGFPGGSPGDSSYRVPFQIQKRRSQATQAGNPPRPSLESAPTVYRGLQNQLSDPRKFTVQKRAIKTNNRSRNRHPRQELNNPIRYSQHDFGQFRQRGVPSDDSVKNPSLDEFYRWHLVKEQIILIPREQGEPGLPLAYMIDPVEPLNHPNIQELQGPREHWAWMMSMNMNRKKYGYRDPRLEKILDEIIFGQGVANTITGLTENTNVSLGGLSNPRGRHIGQNRHNSEASLVWCKEDQKGSFLKADNDAAIMNVGPRQHFDLKVNSMPATFNAVPRETFQHAMDDKLHVTTRLTNMNSGPREGLGYTLSNNSNVGTGTIALKIPPSEGFSHTISKNMSEQSEQSVSRSYQNLIQYLGYSVQGEELQASCSNDVVLGRNVSRRSSPGYFNIARSHSQIFESPIRSPSAPSSHWLARLDTGLDGRQRHKSDGRYMFEEDSGVRGPGHASKFM